MRRWIGLVVAVVLVAAVALADRYQKSSGSSALADGCVQASSGNLTSTGLACGSGGSAHTIKDEGSNLTQRSGLNFVGAGVTCADDAGNNETDCTVSGGGASVLDDLTDATITTPATGATLIYNGTVWIDGALDLADADARTGTLAVGNGGTGLTSGTSGGVLAFTGSGTVASSSALTAGGLVVGGGAGAAPSALAVQSNGQIPIGDGSGAPTLATIAGTANQITVTNGAGTITLAADSAMTTDSELSTITQSTSAPDDGTDACNTNDIWFKTSATIGIYLCVNGATDDWTGPF